MGHYMPAQSALECLPVVDVTEHRRRIIDLHAWLAHLRRDEQMWAVFNAGGLDGSTVYGRMGECLSIADEQLGRVGDNCRSSIETDTKGTT